MGLQSDPLPLAAWEHGPAGGEKQEEDGGGALQWERGGAGSVEVCQVHPLTWTGADGAVVGAETEAAAAVAVRAPATEGCKNRSKSQH